MEIIICSRQIKKKNLVFLDYQDLEEKLIFTVRKLK